MAAANQAVRTPTSANRLKAGASLETIEQVAAKQADAIRERMQRAKKQTQRLQDTSEQLQEAVKRGDIDQVKIIAADFQSASQDAEQNSQDLAQAMIGLTKGFKDIGIALEEVQEQSEDEKKLVTDAEALVARKESELRVAQDERVRAGTKTNFLGVRDRAVEEAKEKVNQRETELATAKAGVEAAKQLAAQRQRDRLKNMDLEHSLQRLQSITTQISTIAKERVGEIETNLESIQTGRVEMGESLKKLAIDVEAGDQNMKRVNAELSQLLEQQREQTANSPEWTTLEAQIRDKQSELAMVESDRNKAFAASQDGQRFLQMYDVQEQSQRGLLQFHQMWITTLETGVEQRSILYESHLGVIRAAGDQAAMSMVDKVATETDERLTEDAARHLSAIQGNAIDRLKAIPEQVKRLRDIKSASDLKKAAFDRDFNGLLDQFHHNWGTPAGFDDAQPPQPGA
jgi:chromosome segregation ATPase